MKQHLKRINLSKFDWDMEIDEEGIYIKVYYKNTELKLIDVFGGEFGHAQFVENVAKRIFKEKYGLKYNSFRFQPKTSGYYGSRAKYYIYFDNSIPNDSNIERDLKNLKQKYKFYSTSTTGEQIGEKDIIYKTEIDGNLLIIEMYN